MRFILQPKEVERLLESINTQIEDHHRYLHSIGGNDACTPAIRLEIRRLKRLYTKLKAPVKFTYDDAVNILRDVIDETYHEGGYSKEILTSTMTSQIRDDILYP